MGREDILHASCVALNGRAILIVGPSGSGKSALALELMAFGATLVADDRTKVERKGVDLIASAPAAIGGLIEARGFGILRAESTTAPVAAVVDLAQSEQDRLPEPKEIELLGQSVTLFAKVNAPHFAASIVQFLKSGRQDPECMRSDLS